MRRRVRFGGLVFAIALVIGACGSDGSKPASPAVSSSESAASTSSSSGGASALVDACKLSDSDVSSIVGFTVTKDPASDEHQCQYGGTCGDQGCEEVVTVGVKPFFGGDEGAKIRADDLARRDGATAVEVSGVGDKAFFGDVGDIGEQTGLVVFSGTTEVSVGIQAPVERATPRKDVLIALAKKLLS